MTLQLNGALLAKQDGDSIQYRYRCDKCGHIEGTIRSTAAKVKGGVSFASFNCYNCGHLQQVEIRE
jgi:transcription elongation factor Elf1